MSFGTFIKKTAGRAVGMTFLFAAGLFVGNTAGAAGDVAVNEANFPDENFRSYVAASFDADKNNVLSEAECAAVTSINVRGRDISDLTGIASFKNLVSVNCSSNNISSLNVSSNTELNYLNVSSNQLTVLDVSKNVHLRTLICDGNKLSGLDLKKNGDLNYVDVSGNELSQIDITGCPVIAILNLADNQLMTVNLKNNKGLTSLDVNHNQISSLDLTGNAKLTNVNASYNNLTQLDVSANSQLSNLECTNNNLINIKLSGAVASLACGSNKLTALDVSMLAGLQTLDIAGNDIYELDLSANKELISLNASNNRLGCLDLTANTLLKPNKISVNGNKREMYVNEAGEIIASDAGVVVDKIISFNTAGAVTGQAITTDVTGTAIIVANKNSIPSTIEYTYDMGNGNKAAFVMCPSAKKKLLPATAAISIYMTDGKEEYPFNVTMIGGDTSVSWSSSNNSVAAVSTEGVVKAVAPGTATVTASAAGYDSAVFTVNVYKQPVGINVSAIDVQYYTGAEVKPLPVVKDGDVLLTQNIDYMLSYENNIQAGNASVVIKGCGRYAFTLTKRFDICYNIATLVASAIPDQIFTGQELKPDVSIMNGTYKLVLDKDYTLTYMNNIALGTGIVTITGKGKYAGVKIQSFNIIVPQVTNLVKSGNYKNKIVLTWNKIDGVTGYRVYRYNATTKKYAYLKQIAGSANATYTDTGLKAGTNYRYRVRAYVTVNKVKNFGKYSSKLNLYTKFKAVTLTAKAGTKKATLSWKKITGVTGYRVYMKTGTGKFKKITDVKGASKVKYTKTGLTKKKTYYFRVRAFKTVKGVNTFGAYSTIKTVIAK